MTKLETLCSKWAPDSRLEPTAALKMVDSFLRSLKMFFIAT
jgi:hypothetical protein